MKRVFGFAMSLVLASSGAFAAQSNGSGALALAAIVGEQSPTLTPGDKMVLAHFLAGETNFTLPSGVRQIIVKADKITCRQGDVALAEHSCVLTFGAKTITLSGRAGQLLLATLVENGVTGEGAAGTFYYSVAPLSCTIDAVEIQSNDGGGASCTFTNG